MVRPLVRRAVDRTDATHRQLAHVLRDGRAVADGGEEVVERGAEAGRDEDGAVEGAEGEVVRFAVRD